jgi:hypothetical protein
MMRMFGIGVGVVIGPAIVVVVVVARNSMWLVCFGEMDLSLSLERG